MIIMTRRRYDEEIDRARRAAQEEGYERGVQVALKDAIWALNLTQYISKVEGRLLDGYDVRALRKDLNEARAANRDAAARFARKAALNRLRGGK